MYSESESTTENQLVAHKSKPQQSYSFEVNSYLVQFHLINDDLLIELMQLHSEKFYYSKHTYQSLKLIAENIMNDFQAISSIIEELVLSIAQNKLTINHGQLKMNYQIIRRKDAQTINRYLLLPTAEITLTEAELNKKTIATLKQKVIKLIDQKKQYQRIIHEARNKLTLQEEENLQLNNQLEDHKIATNHQIEILKDDFEEMKNHSVQEYSKIQKKLELMEVLINKGFFNLKSTLRDEMGSTREKSQDGEKKFNQENFSDEKGKKFIFTMNKTHQAFDKFFCHGNQIIRNHSHSISYFKIVSQNYFPKKGRHYFEVKLTNSSINHCLVYGIVDEEGRRTATASGGKQEIYYYNHDPFIRSNSIVTNVERKLEIGEVLTIIVDNDEHQVIWLIQGNRVGSSQIDESLWAKKMYAYVAMYYPEASVQLIN